MNKPFVNVDDSGLVILGARPTPREPGKHDYRDKPVRLSIHHNLTIELHGEQFSASHRLAADEALALISMLGYVLREELDRKGVK